MYNNSAMYDFEIFEKPIEKAKVYELPSVNERRSKKHAEKLKFYTRCFSLILTSAVMVGGFLFGQAKLVECNSKVAVSSRELDELKSKNEQLGIKLNSANANKNFSNKDVEECVEMVEISSGDKAKIS